MFWRDTMPGIAIMTDSNCGIMPAEGEKLGIHVLPMPVIIDGRTYYEGIDITLEQFMKNRYPAALISQLPAFSGRCDGDVGRSSQDP